MPGSALSPSSSPQEPRTPRRRGPQSQRRAAGAGAALPAAGDPTCASRGIWPRAGRGRRAHAACQPGQTAPAGADGRAGALAQAPQSPRVAEGCGLGPVALSAQRRGHRPPFLPLSLAPALACRLGRGPEASGDSAEGLIVMSSPGPATADRSRAREAPLRRRCSSSGGDGDSEGSSAGRQGPSASGAAARSGEQHARLAGQRGLSTPVRLRPVTVPEGAAASLHDQ